MKWLKRIAVAVVVLLVALAVVPFFITLNDYIPVVEKEIATRVGQPVSIDNLHASLLPVPHARIDGITIGDAADIRIAKLTFTPALGSLLRPMKVIRSVDVDDLVLTQQALGTLAALAQNKDSATSVRVEKIGLHGASVKLERSTFGPFDMNVVLDESGQDSELLLATRDKSLKARAVPQRDHFLLEVTARAWTPPAGPAIRFDELVVKGVARNTGAELSDVHGKLYGGVLAGKMSLGWQQGFSLRGNLALTQIELKHAVELVSPTTRVSGRLDAKPVFSARAKTAAQIGEALRIETPFTVTNGVLYGIDLPSAVENRSGQASRGGETRFSALAGHLVAERGTYRFTNLRVASGNLAAQGHVTITPSRALQGELSTSVKALGRSASVPLIVAGTLDSPLVYPNALALAGAAVGGARDVGSSAGSKLGGLVSEIFGGRKR